MKRRKVLKNIGLFTSGMLLFPSCDFSDEKVSILLNKLHIDAKQEFLVEAIVGTLLPEGEIPGGLSLKVQNFVWVMIDDCSTKETQESFLNGLAQFDMKVLELSKKYFVNLKENDRANMLKNLIKSRQVNSDIQNFLNTTKRIAISGYMNSEYIMTQQMPYKLVPGAGSYVPCKTINPTEKINING
jgi:hypothetical protein